MSMTNIESMKQNNCILHWTGAVASSNSPKAITSAGDVKQLLPFPGAGIGMFDGSGDYIQVSNGSDLTFTGDFTIEFDVLFTTVSADQTVFQLGVWNSGGLKIMLNGTASTIVCYALSSNTTSASYALSINTWYRVTLVRSNGVINLYVNGSVYATGITNSGTVNGTLTNEVLIGCATGGAQYFNGRVSEVRASNIARYTANFTPPKRQLESDNNTKLLLHFNRNDTTFIDSSPSAHTITPYGDARQLCSPCGSGVAYFDGSGDYLTAGVASDWSNTGDFTFEGDIYLPSSNSYAPLFSNATNADLVTGIWMSIGTTAGFQCIIAGTLVVSGYAFTQTLNTWHHWAVVRSGSGSGNVKFYWDGTLITSGTSTENILSSYPMRIGHYGPTSGYGGINAYMSDVKYSNNARYTTNFTPSTTPFRPDPNTKLLLHMDGVGNAFYDSSDPPGDNGFPILPDGVTVTPNGTFAVEKMKDGRNVWKFDGSTNYITISDHASWSMFLNDFTIAGWIKFDSVAANKVIIGQYTDANNQWYLQWTTGNIIQLYGITSSTARFDYSCPLTAAANTWYHIVVQRSGSSCIMYINGVAQTVTQTTEFSATATDIAAVLSIGKINTGYQTGNVKDLQIFTKALTMDQVSALMSETYIY